MIKTAAVGATTKKSVYLQIFIIFKLKNSAYPLLKAAGAFYYSWVEGKSNKLEVSMDMSTSFSLLEVIF